MRIATWNVNSIKQRLDHLLRFLEEANPDVLCLQEIKCVEEAFPTGDIEARGYNVAVNGQKGFNGVAILSKRPLQDIVRRLPGDEDDTQSRYLEAVLESGKGVVRVASIYLPNGNPVSTQKFSYKLAWMDRLIAHARARLAYEEPLVLAGDYNVIPEPRDAKHPDVWRDDALFQPETRARYRALLHLGFADAVRACHDDGGMFTFWDYQAGAFQRDNGIRIDHLVISPQAADRLERVVIHKGFRGLDKPSDHVPVSIELSP